MLAPVRPQVVVIQRRIGPLHRRAVKLDDADAASPSAVILEASGRILLQYVAQEDDRAPAGLDGHVGQHVHAADRRRPRGDPLGLRRPQTVDADAERRHAAIIVGRAGGG